MREKTESAILASGSVFRPEIPGPPDYVGVPLYLRSVGHNRRPRGEEEHVPAGEKNFVQLFWGVEGEGEFQSPVGGAPSRLGPGDVLYRLPGEAHDFTTLSEVWTYRWITFDGAGAGAFMEAYRYPRESWAAGPCPHALFASLAHWLQLRTPHSWRLMAAGITRMLALAGGPENDSAVDGTVLEAVELCKRRFADPDLNINAIAAALGVARTTLLRAFQRYMGQSPSEYLSQVRLQAAFAALADPGRPLKNVAGECGFRDVNYFCRFLKQRTGRRPTEIRETGMFA